MKIKLKAQRFSMVVFVISACLLAMNANANTITLTGYKGSSSDMICASDCDGFIGSSSGTISLSTTNAAGYDKAGSPTAELAKLNALLAQFDPAQDPVSFVNKTEGAASTFTTNRQYFSIKKSTNLWFFENSTGGDLTITALGSDWSHVTEYGSLSVSAVPLPAAAWLFGSALLGLIAVAKRKRV
tara:strand:+ start:200 stop:754 length:555 start_codon:yes stop_codon:yes gene_type:complete